MLEERDEPLRGWDIEETEAPWEPKKLVRLKKAEADPLPAERERDAAQLPQVPERVRP